MVIDFLHRCIFMVFIGLGGYPQFVAGSSFIPHYLEPKINFDGKVGQLLLNLNKKMAKAKNHESQLF